MAILFIPSSGGGDPSAAITPSSLTLPTIAPLAAPGALTATATANAGNPNGTYTYKVTLVTAFGETTEGTASASASPASKTVSLTNIPLGGTGTVARNVYRIKDGGTLYFLLTTIANNSATTYTDDTADASLGTASPPLENNALVGLITGQLYYDTVGTRVLTTDGTSIGTMGPLGDGYLHQGANTSWRYGVDDNVGGFVIANGYSNTVLSAYNAPAGLAIYSHTQLDGQGDFSPGMAFSAATDPYIPYFAGVAIALGSGQNFGVQTLPTTTDPDVAGTFFTCTGGELAGLLAGGAKYVLLSKHA